MSDAEAAHLQAVIDNPDDDGPRLVYADWLDEQGGTANRDRAEFIRVQCALWGLRPDDPHCGLLQKREAELLQRYWPTWVGPACEALGSPVPVQRSFLGRWLGRMGKRFRTRSPGWPYQLSGGSVCALSPDLDAQRSALSYHAKFESVSFTRGFIDSITLPCATLVDRAGLKSLAQLTPIRWLSITLGSTPASDLIGPHLDWVRDLTVFPDPFARSEESVVDRLVQEMASRDVFPRLRSIYLDVAPLQELRTVELLAASAVLSRLQQLDLTLTSPLHVRTLAESPNVSQLKHLKMYHSLIRDEGASAIAGSPHFAQLESLGLWQGEVGDEGVRQLAETPFLPSLKALDLDGNPITDLGVRHLAGSSLLGRLGSLSLSRCDSVTASGLQALAESSATEQLECLCVDGRHTNSPAGRLLRERLGERLMFHTASDPQDF